MDIHSGLTPAPPAPGDPTLLIHGGAWNIPDDACEEHLHGLQEAVELGRTRLAAGQSALDVVTAVAATMERHGAFDAGRGAVLTQDGTVELDAGVMDGATLAFGAVAGIQHFLHPSHIARRLLEAGEGQVRLLHSYGAERFAENAGFTPIPNESLICPRERARYERLRAEADFHTSHAFQSARAAHPRGTIGCVARDVAGRLAAATSTGGTPFRPSGRIGDSPLPGCGFYANAQGAASATGWGEAIATVLLAGRAVDALAGGTDPRTVAARRVRLMGEQVENRTREAATGGLILLDATGRGGWAFSTPRMARGGWVAGSEPWVAI